MSSNEGKNGYTFLMHLRESEIFNANQPTRVFLDRPKIRAIYTVTSTNEVTDDVHLPYFKEPKATAYPLDLNKGFDQFIFRRNINQNQLLDKVLKFVLESEHDVLQLNALQNPQGCGQSISKSDKQSSSELQNSSQVNSKRKVVLCQRGVLSRIMVMPYRLKPSGYDNVKFFATRYCGILHLSEISWSDNRTKYQSYHNKFAQVCLSDDPDLDPITDVPVDENNVNFGIYHTNLKDFDLIYSAEMGGVISDHKIADVHNMDEINKYRFIYTKQLWNKQNSGSILKDPKFLLWWVHCYLTNTNDICIGLKDKDGVVRTPVQLHKVQDIPKNQYWKPQICTDFLQTLLTKIETLMAEVDCPYTVYEFVNDPYLSCIMFKIHSGKSKRSFLSETYIKYCKEIMENK